MIHVETLDGQIYNLPESEKEERRMKNCEHRKVSISLQREPSMALNFDSPLFLQAHILCEECGRRLQPEEARKTLEHALE